MPTSRSGRSSVNVCRVLYCDIVIKVNFLENQLSECKWVKVTDNIVCFSLSSPN